MPQLTRKGWSCAVVLVSLVLGCSGELSHHPLCDATAYVPSFHVAPLRVVTCLGDWQRGAASAASLRVAARQPACAASLQKYLKTLDCASGRERVREAARPGVFCSARRTAKSGAAAGMRQRPADQLSAVRVDVWPG